MTTDESKQCNDKDWSRDALISKTNERIVAVQKYYDIWLKVTTDMRFKLSEHLSVVTETFNHAFNDLKYKLDRLKVISKLLNSDKHLMQCKLDKNTINELIQKYNASPQSGVDNIQLYDPDSNARDFFKNALKESVNEGYPKTIVEKTIQYHFKQLVEFAKSNNPEASPELDIADPKSITKYVKSACNKDCNKEDTNQVLKNAKTILIPFLKYEISTTDPNKTGKKGGRKNKTVTRKMRRRRRSYRKNGD